MRHAANRRPTIGLVCQQKRLSDRILKALEGYGFPVALHLRGSDLDGLKSSKVGVVVVVGELESRESSLLARIRELLPAASIVAIAGPVETSTLRWALESAADGVVWETRLEETLDLTLRAVHAGQLVMPPAFRRRQNTPRLTNREKQVLSLVIMGLTNREIASKLYLSESTVKSHLNTSFRKLGVGSRAEAEQVITDPDEGLGTGILAITAPGLARGRRRES